MEINFTILAFALQFVCVIISGVWVVGKIRTTTEVLNNTILSLSSAINKLEKTLEKIEDKYVEHEIRISNLENHTGFFHNAKS